jgi:signal peptidase I
MTLAADELALTHEEGLQEDAAETRRGTDWWAELRGILWLVLAVLGFHSLVAKPFYIPSESMMPGLLVGDRLVVTKYPYGYSFVTPTFHLLPFMPGRLFGSLPEARRRGDRDAAGHEDGLYQARDRPARRHDRSARRRGLSERQGDPAPRCGTRDIPVDANTRCDPDHYRDRLVGRRRQGLLPPADLARDVAQRPLLRHRRTRLEPAATISPRSACRRTASS